MLARVMLLEEEILAEGQLAMTNYPIAFDPRMKELKARPTTLFLTAFLNHFSKLKLNTPQ